MEDLIRKSKIYNYIKAQINPFGKPFEGDVYEFGIKLMEYIEQMDAEESVTDTNVGSKWIPCSERLPDIKEGKYASDCVLVTLKWWDGEISETVGWYNRTGTWSEDGKMSKVIAWMPYEPYKGE